MVNKRTELFMAICEAGSFSKAEATTYMSRQALKKHIDALEDDLGFTVFVRSERGITLTDVGSKYYHEMKRINAEIVALTEECRKISKQEDILRIAVPVHPNLILDSAFREFTRLYPSIRLEILYPDVLDMADLVAAGSIDAAECVLSDKIDFDKIGFTKIGDLNYSCVLSKSHPLSNKEVISPVDLRDYVVSIRKRGNSKIVRLFKTKFPEIKLHELTGHDVTNMATVCYNNEIYISKAYFAKTYDPWISIPLDVDFKYESSLIYKKEHSRALDKFIKIVEKGV